MYNAFTPFLSLPTWHTSHDSDAAAFYKCLAKVVCNDDFSPERMGEEFRNAKGQGFDQVIDELVNKAWAIHDFLKATGGCECYAGSNNLPLPVPS